MAKNTQEEFDRVVAQRDSAEREREDYKKYYQDQVRVNADLHAEIRKWRSAARTRAQIEETRRWAVEQAIKAVDARNVIESAKKISNFVLEPAGVYTLGNPEHDARLWSKLTGLPVTFNSTGEGNDDA